MLCHDGLFSGGGPRLPVTPLCFAKDAALEAVRLWGEDGFVRHRLDGKSLGLKPYAVGKRDGVLFLSGEGTSWEEAFEEASRQPGTKRQD
jgi:hypothetical protein